MAPDNYSLHQINYDDSAAKAFGGHSRRIDLAGVSGELVITRIDSTHLSWLHTLDVPNPQIEARFHTRARRERSLDWR